MTIDHAMGRSCGVWNDTLVAFSLGDAVPDLHAVAVPEADIEEHIAGCDECQAFLAELWEGELERDLSEPVIRILEMERFLIDTGRLGGGMLADLLRAFMKYGLAAIDETGPKPAADEEE